MGIHDLSLALNTNPTIAGSPQLLLLLVTTETEIAQNTFNIYWDNIFGI